MALCIEREIGVAAAGSAVREQTYEYTQELDQYIVPSTGEYRITAKGAKAADGNEHAGGTGAVISATFTLCEGDRLDILVGV